MSAAVGLGFFRRGPFSVSEAISSSSAARFDGAARDFGGIFYLHHTLSLADKPDYDVALRPLRWNGIDKWFMKSLRRRTSASNRAEAASMRGLMLNAILAPVYIDFHLMTLDF
jgi:hypothetical protein